MAVVVKCNSCGVRARAKDQLAGKRVRCKCGAVLKIPQLEPMDDVAELSVLEGLEGGGAVAESEPRCPGCLALMPAGAVLCTACGYNKQTGRRLSVSVVDAAEPTATAPSPNEVIKARAKSQLNEDRAGRAVQIMIKILVVAVIVGGVGGVGWIIKSSVAFDPKQQAADAMAKVTPGMTVQQAVDAVGKGPAEVCVIGEQKQAGPLGLTMPVERKIPYQPDFMHVVDYKLLQYGFHFVYKYSLNDVVHIYFDEEGKVLGTELIDPHALIWQR